MSWWNLSPCSYADSAYIFWEIAQIRVKKTELKFFEQPTAIKVTIMFATIFCEVRVFIVTKKLFYNFFKGFPSRSFSF